ncbi:hypothetical protein [Haloflavibacter putidus]|uniref:Uncharacterized protein n=1 Tax=Haloflavibacter putidus TaxID=2576776 RepID=A0A508A105_9FLAO|nr:hypothetical protein [Haloflavibacter putidus]TQD40625.1 hypothetical protein FKR84_01205 [Haloflavibacter putidus]
METSAVIMGFIFLLLFITPIFYTIILRKKRKSTWETRIQEKAKAINFNLDELEINTKLFMALDRGKKQLLFGYLNPENFEVEQLSLENAQVNLRELRTKEQGIKNVELILNNGKQTNVLDFFSTEDDYRLEGVKQLAMAQKWEKKLC